MAAAARSLGSVRREVHVAQRFELAEGFLLGPGVGLVLGLVQTGLPFHFLPRGDGLDLRRLHEGLRQRRGGHVTADGKAEQGQDRRRDVEQARTVEPLVDADAGAGDAEDAEGAVLDGGPRRDLRDRDGPEVVGVEAVVGEQDDRRLGPDPLKQVPEHEVVEAVDGLDGAPVEPVVGLAHVGHPGRVVLHEPVPDVVDRVEVDGREVPRLVVHEVRRRRLDAGGIGEDLAREDDARVVRWSTSRGRNERQHWAAVSSLGWTRSSARRSARRSG